MSNVRTTASALLNTVETTATSVTKVFSTANRAVDMLDRYVAEHQYNQALRIKADRHVYRTNLINRIAMEQSKAEEQITREIENNEVLSEHFKRNFDTISKLLANEE